MVEITRIRDGVVVYANERILPKLTPGKQFVAGTAIGIAAAKAETIARTLAENELVKTSGLVAENGMVDLDTLYEAALEQVRKQRTLPVEIPMIGRMTFDESDLTELYRTIMTR